MHLQQLNTSKLANLQSAAPCCCTTLKQHVHVAGAGCSTTATDPGPTRHPFCPAQAFPPPPPPAPDRKLTTRNGYDYVMLAGGSTQLSNFTLVQAACKVRSHSAG